MGHPEKFVAVTNGDAGHQSEGGGALAKHRRAEAQESGRRLGIQYDVLEGAKRMRMVTVDRIDATLIAMTMRLPSRSP